MRFLKRLVEAQQRKANQEVARQLWYTEFRHEEYSYVLNMVNNGRVHELLK